MNGQKPSLRFIESCYRLYEQKMYRIAYTILRDPQLAEDAVQEAFLKLMKGSADFEDVGSDDCRRYLLTVIKHASIDIYRKQQKLQETAYLTNREPEEAPVPEVQSDFSEIQELLDALPPKYRDVVYCIAIREFSVRETALELDISEALVRKRLERARKMLNRKRRAVPERTVSGPENNKNVSGRFQLKIM